jgi:hypothetical protein
VVEATVFSTTISQMSPSKAAVAAFPEAGYPIPTWYGFAAEGSIEPDPTTVDGT